MATVTAVAPPVGAWIETYMQAYKQINAWSRPPWARGLKHYAIVFDDWDPLSRPPWARGLKQAERRGGIATLQLSRPPWARGLKPGAIR